jgi:hypothetical protein
MKAERILKINSASAYLNPFLLIVWFFVWGICPWATPVASAAEEQPASHAHSEATGPHHASKGTEHSCSGAVSYTKSDLGSDRLFDPAGPIEATPIVLYRCAGPNHPYFFELIFLPRLLTEYYQLYSVYRI